ncbi:VanZ family protein [Wenjunlia tyrosinilytica]|uniref:VanZ-like domain-containing protein n=1 Tax=Wenjunlia tyrosinilytica TaxID=1544741 RepID=A0A917ZHM1_9ACTN|nr:VanZ family protein [Wenjunlia tyrosinilytica]GGO83230.1 hypothetical protein GCM10012280_11710 [Wenjunlia tyrosinilytica]
MTGALLVVAHLAFVAWFTLRPLYVPWVYGNNVQLFATIDRILLTDPVAGVRTIGSGLIVLAPLGVLLPMVSGKVAVSTLVSLIRTVFLGAAVSFVLECLQSGVPGRVFDVDSILLNTTGVAIAHLAVVPTVRARLRRRGRVHVPRQQTAARRAQSAQGTVSYEVAAHLHR